MDRELPNGRKLRPNEWLHFLGSMGKEGVDKNIEGVGLGMQVPHNNKRFNI